MSEKTWKAVEESIAAHIADANGGAYLTGFVLIACGVSPEDESGSTRYSVLEQDGQAVHVSLGLTQYLRMLQAEVGIGGDS